MKTSPDNSNTTRKRERHATRQDRVNRTLFGVAFSISFLFGIAFGAGPSVEDWIERQVWFANLESSFPAGVTLSLSAVEENEPGWESVRIREVHAPDSGADPAVSPTVGFFRVSENREMVEWMDPVTGEWDSLSAFLRARKTSAMNKQGNSDRPEGERKMANTSNASPTPHETSAPRTLLANLDDDENLERVCWKPMDFIGSDKFYFLEAIDDNGETLWTGPQDRTMENAYVYFDSHFGSSFPQLLFDIDNDGNLELLAPEPQSDVSATFFRRLRWKDGSFRPLSSAALMPTDADPDRFVWREEDVSLGTWVSQFGSADEAGLVQARVTRYTEEGEWKGGAALLKFTADGATVEEWVHPLQTSPPNITMANDPAPAPDSSESSELSGFPLSCSLAVEYSEKAHAAIQSSGGTLRASLIIDQYGPQYMEEEAIAVLDQNFALDETLEIRGIPYSNPKYQIIPGKTYKLTVMILPAAKDRENIALEAYSADGKVDWDTSEIQGRTLVYRCKLIAETGEPPMMKSSSGTGGTTTEKNTLYDPFSDVDMNQFFTK